jgi:hypothetical protein
MNDITVVKESTQNIPEEYALGENYPNPFNPVTKIPYSLAKTSEVHLVLYDHLGRQVQTLIDEVQSPGTHEAIFDAQNMASGIYFYQLRAGSYINLKKMILIK